MLVKFLAVAVLGLLAAMPALAQQRQAGGCANGFCAIPNAPQQEAAADIDQIDADMKRQMSGAPAQSQAPAQAGMGRGGMGMMGMMNMCPCMRMMAMMRMQGGMGMGGMQDMPGMSQPKPDEKKAPAQ
jgi:hypothetical protein